MTAGDPPGRPPRKPFWSERRMALAAVALVVLAVGRTVFDLVSRRGPDGLPGHLMEGPWAFGALVAALLAASAVIALLLGRSRATIALAGAAIALLIAYRLFVLA